MLGKRESRKKYSSRDIIIVALLAAILVSAKFALQLVPNVEVVTLFLFVFTCSIGFSRTILACLIFCALDNLLYPLSPDVTASYFTYFPLLVIAVKLVNLKKTRNEFINCALSLVMTLLFGVITTFYQALIMSQDFIRIYIAGIVFFAIHTASNTIVVLILFKPLTKLIIKLNDKT